MLTRTIKQVLEKPLPPKSVRYIDLKKNYMFYHKKRLQYFTKPERPDRLILNPVDIDHLKVESCKKVFN
jgi:hypothetical protein